MLPRTAYISRVIANIAILAYNINMPIDDYYKMQKLKKPFGIGKDIFANMGRAYYVDKTLFVRDIIYSETDVILFTRPRRFGKTLNMTMLQTFFEKPLDGKDTSHYFKNLKIWQCGDEYTSEQGKRPVIFITLKDVKTSAFDKAFFEIKKVISSEFQRHSELEQSIHLDQTYKDYYFRIKNRTALDEEYSTSIKTLSEMLEKHYGEKTLVLIDEYDAPIQAGFEYGFYDKIVEFMRILLSSVLKNPSLYKGILTGVTRVSKESIFSGLNNISVNTIFDKDFSEYFGLTQEEVDELFKFYGIEDKREEARKWYDGYMFGKTEIYNPWSVLKYIQNECTPMSYWVNTSANELVGQALEIIDRNDRTMLENLITGNTIEKRIDTNLVYHEITRKSSAAYSLLTQTGYLKSVHTEWDNGYMICTLTIPNQELKTIYYKEIIERFIQDETAGEKAYELRRAMTKGNAEKIEQLVQDYLMSSLNFHDLTEEKDYHNVFLGLVYIATDNYSIKSNRESGEGRYDIAMFPKRNNLPGIIFELKHCSDGESVKADKAKLEQLLSKSAEEALKQIESNEYLTELKEAGANPIFKYGAAFCGKKAKVIRKCC